MTTFKIGISDYPYDRARYHGGFNLVEHRVGLTAPPGPKVLRRWAREAPVGFEHVWIASQHFTHDPRSVRTGQPVELGEGERRERLGLFQDTPESRRQWAGVRESAEAIGASIILLETPASLAPSPANKARMRSFATTWAEVAEGRRLAWQPAGFWQREEAIELSQELGWLLAVDPMVDPDEPMPPGATAYLRMAGRVGLGTSYTADDFAFLLDLVEPYEEVYLALRTERPLRDAGHLKRLIAEVHGPEALALPGGATADDEGEEGDEGDGG